MKDDLEPRITRRSRILLMNLIPSVSSVRSVVNPRAGACRRRLWLGPLVPAAVAGTAGPGALGELTMKGVKAIKNDREARRARTRKMAPIRLAERRPPGPLLEIPTRPGGFQARTSGTRRPIINLRRMGAMRMAIGFTQPGATTCPVTRLARWRTRPIISRGAFTPSPRAGRSTHRLITSPTRDHSPARRVTMEHSTRAEMSGS
jgi:hypothetical protein